MTTLPATQRTSPAAPAGTPRRQSVTTEPELFAGYQPTPIVEAVALHAAVHQRIRELLRFRRWYRLNRWAEWSDLRIANDDELRALIRLARSARRLAR